MNTCINNRTAAAKASASEDYNLDEVIYDVGNIKDMLSAIRYLMEDLSYGTGENRNHPLQRIASLIEVTSDIAEKAFVLIVDNHITIKDQIARRNA